MKKIISCIILTITLLCLLACSKSKEIKEITIGVSPNLKPFIYLDKNKNLCGFDLQIIKAYAEKKHYKLVYVQDNIHNLLIGLNNAKYDFVISALSSTEDRKKIFNLSNPYYNANQAVVCLKNNYLPIQNIDELTAYKIGVLNGSSGQYYIEKLLLEDQSIKAEQIIKSNSYQKLIELLRDKQVDVILIDKTLADYFQNEFLLASSMTIETGENFVVFMQKNSKYKSKMNKFIKKLLKSENYVNLLKEYFLK